LLGTSALTERLVTWRELVLGSCWILKNLYSRILNATRVVKFSRFFFIVGWACSITSNVTLHANYTSG
jgi:hypothetical protein